MGTRGPVPNRETDLARPRSRKGKEHAAPITKGELRKVTVPKADLEWHPISLMLWNSLKTSGQADYYQNSDWAYAYSICEDLSVFKKSGRRSSQMAQTIYSAMSNLLVTEADRRRVRIELQEPDTGEDEASVTAINDARTKLGLA
jgi:hypothetical protein